MTRGRFFAVGAAIVAVVLAIVGLQSIFVVDPTKYALVLRFGEPVDTALEPGLYLKVPFIDNVVYLEKRLLGFSPPVQATLQEENEIVAGDQRRINVLAFGRYRITDPLRFYEAVGTVATANSRLLAILDASVRAVLGDADFQEIVRDNRTDLMQQITDRVAQGATNLGVEVIDVRIQRVDLPEDNADRIYVRMQTERQQEARLIRAQGEEAARRIRAAADREVTVTIANANRDAQILRGAGDGEANLIYAAAYGQDEDFFRFYQSMQAYLQGLTPNTTTLMLSPNSDFFRFFNQIGVIEVPPTPLDPALIPDVPELPEAPAEIVVPEIPPPGEGAAPAGP
jgi:membrane protease subunit HflC